jgi:hypothetical protein
MVTAQIEICRTIFLAAAPNRKTKPFVHPKIDFKTVSETASEAETAAIRERASIALIRDPFCDPFVCSRPLSVYFLAIRGLACC